MDSMRSLNTSLPRTSKRRERSEHAADILSAFKAAALSVTTLYKTARGEEDSLRATGYQDAIDELLEFLDHESLGLGDGEGWKVRQWATERLTATEGASDIDEDSVAGDIIQGSSNNTEETQAQSQQQSMRAVDVDSSSASSAASLNTSSLPAQTSPANAQFSSSTERTDNLQSSAHPPSNAIFHFQSHAVPNLAAITNNEIMQADALAAGGLGIANLGLRSTISGVQPSFNRAVSRNSRLSQRGTKRKLNLPDFFDFGNLEKGPQGGNGGNEPAGKRNKFA